MTEKIRIVDPTEVPQWDRILPGFTDYSFFHSSAWARVLSQSYQYKALYFMLVNDSAAKGLLPVMEVNSRLTGRRGVSLPFTDGCQALADGPAEFEPLFEAARDYGRKHKWKFLEMRGGKFLEGAQSSSRYFFHTLSLSGTEEEVYATFRESTRRNIRKSVASGVTVQILTTEQAVREFYRLNQITRREHGLPPQPYLFFEKIHEHILSQGQGFVALASYRDATVAAAVYFHIGEKAIYKYGASDRQYQHLRPNNLVMWEAIRQCISQGVKSLCLGRTDIEHRGLRQFKMGWGVEEHSAGYYRYDLRAQKFMPGKDGKTFGSRKTIVASTPLPVLRSIGSILYRHMG